MEEKLAAIWSKVLRLERVGVHDNFFELGGDSILSIQIISLARQGGTCLDPKAFVSKSNHRRAGSGGERCRPNCRRPSKVLVQGTRAVDADPTLVF